jgi:hypothetical protein
MFKKDDYIVLENISTGHDGDGFRNNYIYKQREKLVYLRPYLDAFNSKRNGWSHINYYSKYWRYANIEEIKKYDELGKPFNVDIITKENIVVSENLDSLINLIKKCHDNN